MSSTADGWVKLTTMSRSEAELLVGGLLQAGINARIERSTDDPAGWMTAYGGSGGKVDVLVPAEAEEEAKTLLVPSQPASTLPTDRAQRPVYLIGRALLALAILSIVVGLFLSYLR